MKVPLRFLFTAGLGAAAMYYCDPDRGSQRRALARDRLEHGRRQAPEDPDSRPDRFQPPREHAEFMQEIWSPPVRATGGVAGATAALYGLGRGGLRGTLLGAAGLLLLARAITNTELRRLFGIDTPRLAVDSEAGRARTTGRGGSGRMQLHPGAADETPGQPGPVH